MLSVRSTSTSISATSISFAGSSATDKATAVAAAHTSTYGTVSLYVLFFGSGVIWWSDSEGMQRLCTELLRML